MSNPQTVLRWELLKPRRGWNPNPGKEEPRTNLLSPHLWSARRSQGEVGSTGLFFHFLVVLFISGTFIYIHLCTHIVFAQQRHGIHLVFLHKLHPQGSRKKPLRFHPSSLNAGPQDIAHRKGYRLPEGSAGHTGKPGRHGDR